MEIENIFEKSSNPLLALFIAAALALVVGYCVQAIGRAVLLRLTRRFSIVETLVRSTAPPMQIVMPLIFLQLIFLTTPDDWQFMGRVRHLTGLVFIAAMTWLVIRCIAGGAAAIVQLTPVTREDNLHARRIQTQTQVLARSLMFIAMLIGLSLMLMTFPAIRAVGASLLASAGLAGIVAGLAARPVLSNLIAGLQIALSQPIRLDDVLVVEGEWGRVEEITGAYVVVALWDQRRLIVPLQWFIEHPFQNWTRSTSQLIGTVFLWVDYGMPLQPLREEAERLCKAAPEWDGRFTVLQVTDVNERAMQLRILVTSVDSGKNFDLRCKVREGLLEFMQKNYPRYLPRVRTNIDAIEGIEGIEQWRNGTERRVDAAKESGNGLQPGSPALDTRGH